MADENPASFGVVMRLKTGCGWVIQFHSKQLGQWPAPDAAAVASRRQQRRLPDWDQARLAVPDDLFRRQPLGESF